MINLILEIKTQLLKYLDEQAVNMQDQLTLKTQLYDKLVKALQRLKDHPPDPQDKAAVANYKAELEKIKSLMAAHQNFQPTFDYKDYIGQLEREITDRLDLKAYLQRLKDNEEAEQLRKLRQEEEDKEQAPKKEWSIKFRGKAIYRTIQWNNNTQFMFNVKDQIMETKPCETPKMTQNYAFVEQIGDDTFVISGGEKDDANRLTFVEGEDVREYQMSYARGWHRTAFDREHSLYIISGMNYTGKQPMPVRECEVFDTSTEKSSRIQRIPNPVYAFGCCFVIDKVYVFGGYNANRGGCENTIQMYDPRDDRWLLHEKRLPILSECSAAYVPAMKSVLVWRNGGRLSKTYLFDFSDWQEHGEKFPGSSFVYSQPLVAWDEVYVWDARNRLYVYDLQEGSWSKPLGVPSQEEVKE